MQLESIEPAAHRIRIFLDVDAENPREFSSLGKMVCFHSRHILGDENEWDSGDYNGWDEMEAAIRAEGAVVILPLYLYDHSGITMSTGAFSCGWDSGQVGFIYALRSDILKCYSRKRLSRQLLARAEKVLEGEVEIYDQWLTGEVYGYQIEGPKCEESCWGFYDREYMVQEARGQIEHVTQ